MKSVETLARAHGGEDPILHLERLAYRAWPAAEVRALGGWRLRYTAGVTRRANSVWPNEADDALPMARQLAAVEDFYTRRELPVRYQICPAAQPPDLDALLEWRGYMSDARTCVQVADSAAVIAATAGRAADPSAVTITPTPSDEWFALYCAAESVQGRAAAVRRGILGRIARRTAYAVLTLDGRRVATGLGVLDGAWLGLFSVATAPEARRRGAATAVLHALASWGRRHAAHALYLQVMRDNLPARTLYERAGFRTLYDYHYRESRLPAR